MKPIIQVDLVKNIANAVFQPADWSIIGLPVDNKSAKGLMSNLYNSPTARHTSLILFRHKRKERLKAMSNLYDSIDNGWSFLDTISICYEKPSSCSNNGFLPLSEFGVLVYKGLSPDISKTKWFNDNMSNATNVWDVSARDYEGQHSRYHKFSSELNLLMYSMCGELEHRRFIYGLEVNQDEIRNIYLFCREYGLTVQLYASTKEELQYIQEEGNKAEDFYVQSRT